MYKQGFLISGIPFGDRDKGVFEMAESMEDYKEELEESFRKIREGDIITGTVIDVNEEE